LIPAIEPFDLKRVCAARQPSNPLLSRVVSAEISFSTEIHVEMVTTYSELLLNATKKIRKSINTRCYYIEYDYWQLTTVV
jgi:hypothetical protein